MGYAIEAKHCGGREPIEVVVDRYQPQLQWIMFVTDTEQIALTIILGANEPIVEYIQRDEEYINEMLTRAQQFMECVKNRTPPVVLPAVPPPVEAAKIYDMTSSNQWAVCAAQWVKTKDAAVECKEAEKVLKSLVPDDAKLCSGHGVRISRNRAGSLSLRVAT